LSGDVKQTPETSQLVLRDFEQIRTTISSPPTSEIDLAAELAQLRETWRGVCDVKIQIDRFSSKLLELDSDAQMAVNEISKEVVSNAYRHGKASQVEILISKQSEQEILLSATNNGHTLAARKKMNQPRRGIGSQMLDEIALEWSIKSDRVAQKTELRAIIAIESNSAN
jgi:signal transduction histidine kinase